jgi:hypothetical protein
MIPDRAENRRWIKPHPDTRWPRCRVSSWTRSAAGAFGAFGAIFCAGVFAAHEPRLPDAVDFNREVRPILSNKCFHCHGPDEDARKGRLRLDTREGATRTRNGFAPVVPGKSGESEMILRVASSDDDEVMPPPDAKIGRLTPAEVVTLERWIDAGASYQSHWSFAPLRPATPPLLRTPTGSAPAVSPIDQLTTASLVRRNLAHQPEVDRNTLIRRVTLDLTGLPPAPGEITAFLADRSPDAVPRLVDRLLASPRYGERMAADWLDVARYADSYGFQIDRERDMWPWRDWVIRAFNENLPWDKFVTYQLAGDLLPGATDEQVLATAFNRLHAGGRSGIRRGGIPDQPRQRSHHHVRRRLPRTHARVRPLSRPQIRSDLPAGILFPLGVFPGHRRGGPVCPWSGVDADADAAAAR